MCILQRRLENKLSAKGVLLHPPSLFYSGLQMPGDPKESLGQSISYWGIPRHFSPSMCEQKPWEPFTFQHIINYWALVESLYLALTWPDTHAMQELRCSSQVQWLYPRTEGTKGNPRLPALLGHSLLTSAHLAFLFWKMGKKNLICTKNGAPSRVRRFASCLTPRNFLKHYPHPPTPDPGIFPRINLPVAPAGLCFSKWSPTPIPSPRRSLPFQMCPGNNKHCFLHQVLVHLLTLLGFGFCFYLSLFLFTTPTLVNFASFRDNQSPCFDSGMWWSSFCSSKLQHS